MRKIGRDLPAGKSREKYIVLGKIHLRIYMEKCVGIFLLGKHIGIYLRKVSIMYKDLPPGES